MLLKTAFVLQGHIQRQLHESSSSSMHIIRFSTFSRISSALLQSGSASCVSRACRTARPVVERRGHGGVIFPQSLLSDGQSVVQQVSRLLVLILILEQDTGIGSVWPHMTSFLVMHQTRAGKNSYLCILHFVSGFFLNLCLIYFTSHPMSSNETIHIKGYKN